MNRHRNLERPMIAAILAFVCLLTGCSEIAGKVQPPVQVTLTSYLLFSGYYVNVRNLSDQTLTNVTVTYLWQGNTHTQTIGTIGPKTTKTIDPADANITVAKHEQIRVSASGFVPKTIDTNTLIDQ